MIIEMSEPLKHFDFMFLGHESKRNHGAIVLHNTPSSSFTWIRWLSEVVGTVHILREVLAQVALIGNINRPMIMVVPDKGVVKTLLPTPL